jgi:MYXO-CTERM domain-containing protein
MPLAAASPRSLLLLCAAAAALAACRPTASPAGRIRRPIMGGQPAPAGAYPEVVAIMDLGGSEPAQYYCSGTLVAPQVVVSAAHCVTDETCWQAPCAAYAPETVGVYFGDDTTGGVPFAQVARVAAVYVPDTYPRGEATNDPTGLGRDDDIAVLVLAEPVPDITPAPVLDAAGLAALAAGTPALMVGFGATNPDYSGDDGRKYFATTPFEQRTDWEVFIGGPGQPDTCPGDSGGPAFLVDGTTRVLVGITVRGPDNTTVNCGVGGIDTLATPYLDWIARVVASDGGVAPEDGGATADAAPQDAAPDGGFPPDDGDAGSDAGVRQGGNGSGCQVAAGGGSGAGLLLLLAAVGLVRRRRN